MVELPDQIDTWRRERQIGEGHFCTVHLVQDDTDRRGALKICTHDDQASKDRLELEESALNILRHPNIPALVGKGMLGQSPYLVTEYVPGQTVKERIDEGLGLGQLFGDIATLNLMVQLLDAVAHIHKQRLVHRDIKDANVIVSPDLTRIHLIDFGFCKTEGRATIRTDDSFWRAGAPRFSPPTKLANPAIANPAHDVFAVGVIAYRMLTSQYPWSVDEDDDAGGVGALRQLQLARPLEPVVEINSYVLPRISRWVSELLDLDETRRPSSTVALNQARAILEGIRADSRPPVRRGTRRIKYPHVIRDALHHDVRLTEEEFSVLNSREMQRLQWITQLGTTRAVYPCATHTRLSHSIGCVARVEQVLRTIEDQEGVRVDPDVRLAARLYALTHDVTHVPFGHTIEDELGYFERHDTNELRIGRLLDAADSEIKELLRHTDYGRDVLAHLSLAESAGEKMFAEIVSGPAGADVLDYVDRDALMCGLSHRIDDAIFRQFRVSALAGVEGTRLVSLLGGKYGLRADREFAVEIILKERYAMFLKVYTHSAKAAASALLGKCLYGALRTKTKDGRLRPEFKESDLEWMGDEALIERLRNSRHQSVRYMAGQLKRRQHPHGVYRAELLEREPRTAAAYGERQEWLKNIDATSPDGRCELERSIAKRVPGITPDQVIVYCTPKAPGHQRVEHWVKESPDSRPSRSGESVSEQIGQKHLGLWELWVFFAGERDEGKRIAVADVAQDLFGLKNMISVYRRADKLF